jgi:hypothetical protein
MAMKNVRIDPRANMAEAARMAYKLHCRLVREWRDGKLVVTLDRMSKRSGFNVQGTVTGHWLSSGEGHV